MHLVAWLSLALLLTFAPLGWPYAVALGAVAVVLLVAHRLVRKRGVAAALRAFNANLYVSSLVLLGVVLDLLIS